MPPKIPIPIISHFFGSSVRFFPMTVDAKIGRRQNTEFDTKMGCRYNTPSLCHAPSKITIKTWAIPLPDYCRAIGYPEDAIRRIINLSNEVFQYFYKTERIPDAVGRLQPTIIMAMEMCDMLTAKLHTSRIKDPIVKSNVIQIQIWMTVTFGMIRRGELRPIRFPKDSDIPPQVLNYLSYKKYKGRGELVKNACAELGYSKNTFYRMVDKAKKVCRMLPEPTKKTGKPKRTRCDKGATWYPQEKALVLAYKKEHPEAGYKKICTALGFTTRQIRGRVKYWLKF